MNNFNCKSLLDIEEIQRRNHRGTWTFVEADSNQDQLITIYITCMVSNDYVDQWTNHTEKNLQASVD